MWVGDVLGSRGGFGSVVLILAEDGGLYGSIRFLDRRAGTFRRFEVRTLGLLVIVALKRSQEGLNEFLGDAAAMACASSIGFSQGLAQHQTEARHQATGGLQHMQALLQALECLCRATHIHQECLCGQLKPSMVCCISLQVSPMNLDGPNPAVAASLPAIHPAAAWLNTPAGLAALYPAIDTTKTIIAEIKDRSPDPPTAAEEDTAVYRGPPEAANAKPATVDTTPPGAVDVTLPLAIPGNIPAFAAEIAASAGLSPAAGMAMATSWVARVQAAAATPPPPVAAPVAEPTTSNGPGAASTGINDRKLLQSTFNIRQDLLMMYTPGAASSARGGGGAPELENTIRARVAETNKAYRDSGVNIDMIMVGLRQVSRV
jgi:hypothetical protein